MKPGRAWIVAVLCAFASLAAPPLAAGQPFDPRPLSEPDYDVTAPDDADALPAQRQDVPGSADTPLYVETYLPKQLRREAPLPSKLPVVLIASPYEGTDPLSGVFNAPQKHHETMARHWAARGYAVSIAHIRGTGKSGGCIDMGGALEQGDLAELVEWAGRKTTWTNGKVGMYGASYMGMAQLEAATSADRRKTRYLKAIVPVAPVTSIYANYGYDGVMDSIATPLGPAIMLAYGAPRAEAITQDDLLADLTQRPGCHGEHLEGTTDFSGNFNPWYRVREHRSRVERIRAATLYVHGLYDTNVYPTQVEGFFDRIRSGTPHKAVIGQWAHTTPDGSVGVPNEPQERYRRTDWTDMATAWLDRWVKGLPTGAEDWPTVQVQDSNGKWRAEPGFPATTGQPASLALGQPEEPLGNGTLGALRPSGSTAYREDSVQGPRAGAAPIGGAIFETAPLKEPLHVTGRPLLDLWLELEDPDAHVVASLEPLAPGDTGQFVPVVSGPIQGRRSAQHLDSLVDGRFEQEQPVKPAIGKPLHVPIRITPADFIVPEGGRLRVVVTGVYNHDPSLSSVPSGGHGTVRILHDPAHPSALRYTVANPKAEVLEVR